MTQTVTGYSRVQIALHWIVVILVAFQFVANEPMSSAWRAFLDGRLPSGFFDPLVLLHIGAGSLILLLALVRIYLRLVRGAPSPPQDEAWLLQFSAEAVHVSIYVLLLSLPATGAAAWLLGMPFAGVLHSWLTNILLGAIALHVGGALFQHVVRRSDVLLRMFKPQSPEG